MWPVSRSLCSPLEGVRENRSGVLANLETFATWQVRPDVDSKPGSATGEFRSVNEPTVIPQ